MRSSLLCRFCKQKLLKCDLVSTVSVYSKSERKRETQNDHDNDNLHCGVLRINAPWSYKKYQSPTRSFIGYQILVFLLKLFRVGVITWRGVSEAGWGLIATQNSLSTKNKVRRGWGLDYIFITYAANWYFIMEWLIPLEYGPNIINIHVNKCTYVKHLW